MWRRGEEGAGVWSWVQDHVCDEWLSSICACDGIGAPAGCGASRYRCVAAASPDAGNELAPDAAPQFILDGLRRSLLSVRHIECHGRLCDVSHMLLHAAAALCAHADELSESSASLPDNAYTAHGRINEQNAYGYIARIHFDWMDGQQCDAG